MRGKGGGGRNSGEDVRGQRSDYKEVTAAIVTNVTPSGVGRSESTETGGTRTGPP